MKKLHYAPLSYLRGGDPPTYFGALPTEISRRLDRSSQHLPTSESTGPSLDDTTQGRSEEARSAAWDVLLRLLAVLVVAMVIISILGLTVFDRQGGNSATAVASLAIGSSSAVLGLLFGCLKAYQLS